MADTEMEVVEQVPEDKGKGKAKAGKRFEIKKWSAVAMWSWAICTDTCAICRNNLYEPSIEYQANPTGDNEHPGLSIAWGACGHVFHLDCIQRWLKTRSACPLCNKEWEFAKIEKIIASASAPAEALKTQSVKVAAAYSESESKGLPRWPKKIMANLDVHSLRSELADLNKQRHEVNERIRSLEGRGRGRGMPGGGRGMPHGGDAWQQQQQQRGGPFPGGRGGRPQQQWGEPGRDDRRGWGGPDQDRRSPPALEPAAQPPPPPQRRVQSAVVVTGGDGDGSRKRAAEGELITERPETKRRNSRLFATALMGTLRKFKEEESREAGTDVAQRRAEVLQRAEQKIADASLNLRQQQRTAHSEQRLAEINRKRELSTLADVKRLEIVYAGKLARREALDAAGFMRTAASPPLYWAPGKHNDATQAALDAARAETPGWKAEQLAELEREKEQLLARGRPLAARAPGTQRGEGNEAAAEDEMMHEEEEEDMGEENVGAPGGRAPPPPPAAAHQGTGDRYAPSGADIAAEDRMDSGA